MKPIASCAALALALTAPATAFAQAQPPGTDLSERQALSQEILAISYPVETREAMFAAVVDQLETQMMAAVSDDIKDDGAREIVSRFQRDLSQEQRAILNRHIPLLMDAWARSYAEVFSAEELRDILAFVETDTGRTFMLRSVEVMSEPHFAAANQAFMNEAMSAAQQRLPELYAELTAYAEK